MVMPYVNYLRPLVQIYGQCANKANKILTLLESYAKYVIRLMPTEIYGIVYRYFVLPYERAEYKTT